MLAAAVLGGCRRGAKDGAQPTGEEIVLQIGAREISLKEFFEDFERAKLERGIAGDPASSKALKDALVAETIKQELILQHARRKGIAVQAEEVAAEIGRIRSNYPGDSFREMLAEQYVAYDEWIERQKTRMLVEKVIAEEIQDKITVTDEEAQAWFAAHPDMASEPERVRVRQILLGTEADAKLVKSRLARGDDFAALAREKSVSPEGREGGEIGLFARGQVPVVMNLVFDLKVNVISDVVQSDYGFHIFEVTERIPARALAFAEVKPRVLDQVRAEKVEKAFPAWLAELAGGIKVARNDSILAAIE